MTYEACLAGIHNRNTFSSVASLARMRRLLKRLGDPQDQIRCIHVAGTNGKGSVCALVESALRTSGFSTGLFTSPYLVDFRERIRVDGEMISEELLIACYETVMAEEQKLEQTGYEPINEFELVTALGFVAFAKAQVDYAVIEVGLGGRFDATNVIKSPVVSCIMPISLDHTAVLGNTVLEIAMEKAGIIKTSCPLVISQQLPEVQALLRCIAEEHDSPVTVVGMPDLQHFDRTGSAFFYGDAEIKIPLLGRYQVDNAATAWEVCMRLNLPKAKVMQGFAAVRWPGRMQYIPGNVDMLIDAGHNPAGISVLLETIDQLFPSREIIAVMAMMRDKAHKICIPMVAQRCKKLIATAVELPRAMSPEELAAEANGICETETASSVIDAITAARAQASPGQLVLVCGSVYAAGEAQKTI